jgi:hypothetical protein
MLLKKRQKVRMCLCGAAVRADARSGRVPDPCKASKFTALAFRGVKSGQKGIKSAHKKCAQNSTLRPKLQKCNPKLPARAVHVMKIMAISLLELLKCRAGDANSCWSLESGALVRATCAK